VVMVGTVNQVRYWCGADEVDLCCITCVFERPIEEVD
jgi:hypothetical protein